eukprot:TRINITY_DN16045_c0_g1_i2.p1 TRINITY_DN16045_c0_g1~~TRINITY_DN16045_c0_g1_i2.p1  ORF type:complete len:574 (+),score=168.19 TRINITY_DN16045_c0_g1_i2:132-1853(+)
MAPYATGARELSRDRQTIKVLAGDFLAPSVLSKLDNGIGMVDVLNHCALDYVCLGNHENDVPYAELMKRICESKFTWISSNMDPPLPQKVRDLPWMVDGKLPLFEIINVGAFKIALLGLLTPDISLYPSSRFNGATMTPTIQKAEEMYELLKGKVDMIVPMTHQGIEDDRAFAEHFGDKFPLIIGGHDHTAYREVVNGSTILKVGKDAEMIGVIDLTLQEGEAPEVDIMTVKSHTFGKDPEVEMVARQHMKVLEKFEHATLFRAQKELTSVGMRRGPTSLAAVLVSCMRDAYRADCGMINSGSIRGSTTYTKGHDFTYRDLRKEIPFDSRLVCVSLSGKVIRDAIAHAREPSMRDPPVETGAYLQTCDALTIKDNVVTHLKGVPLDLDRQYHVVVLYHAAAEKMDDIKPLHEAVARFEVPLNIEASRDVKDTLVSRFSRTAWNYTMKELHLTFNMIDSDKDGLITFEEFLQTAEEQGDFCKIVLQNVWNIMDADNNGWITPSEFLTFFIPLVTSEDTDVLPREQAIDIINKRLGPGHDGAYDKLSCYFNHDGDIDLRKMLKEYIPLADDQIVF